MTVTGSTDRQELRAQLLGTVESIADVLRDAADEAERIGTLPERA